MEIKVLEETKERIIVEIKGESHGFVNALKSELNKDKGVKSAGYNINHPLIGIPKIVIQAKGKDPKTLLHDAAKNIKKQADDFSKAFGKAIK